MKFLKKIVFLTVMLSFLITGTAWANEITWENVSGHHNQSILLDDDVLRATDSVYQLGRGEYLAEGSVEIVNQENGDIYVCIGTYAYINVDKIFHSAMVDYWSEERNDWVQVGCWDFETTKEENNGTLTRLITEFTLTGYETGLYYRVRGLHGVEVYDEIEACATETAGILITDN